MAETKVIEEDWKPGQSRSQYKPAKLARYSFGNIIYEYDNPGSISVTITSAPIQASATIYIIGLKNIELYNSVSSDTPFYTATYINEENPYKTTQYIGKIVGKVDISESKIKIVTDQPSIDRKYKSDTPFVIVDNKENELIYKDLRLEVYVKSEAIVNNYVDNFDLSNIDLNFIHYNTPIPDNTNNWLNINKNIKEYYYNSSFPYVAELVFKNIWGCNKVDWLRTFVKHCYLLVDFPKNFGYYTRKDGYFDKFFDYGVIYNCQFRFGETFNKDIILGNTKLENYFEVNEYKHDCFPQTWEASGDSTLEKYFGGRVSQNFTHFYEIWPVLGIPFFKEKEFTDSYVELDIRKLDVLGNTVKRIIKLPVHVLFTNNLIKLYWLGEGQVLEYLNSTNIYSFTSKKGGVHNNKFKVWCPNAGKLSWSYTYTGNANLIKCELEKSGQLSDLKYEYNSDGADVGDILDFMFLFEYSDGENYDKFTFHVQSEIIS